MIGGVSFTARARAVDHLGREQIADGPTAVSELWKNSYDAYARNVQLHVFDGERPAAAISDDGHGMNADELKTKWLVIGTDSKLGGQHLPEDDRNGLPERVRQGQKGIGRLSCAALGNLALLISKRRSADYCATLIDWRLFENPYLLLNDIVLPFVEFAAPSEFPDLLSGMYDRLIANIWGSTADAAQADRVKAAWDSFDALELEQGRNSTRASIEEFVIAGAFSDRHLKVWDTWNGAKPSGTLLLMSGLRYDLRALLLSDGEAQIDPAAQNARTRMFDTLSSFVDPFSVPPGSQNEFNYSVEIWRGDLPHEMISGDREFNSSNFEMLEHVLEGVIDTEGVFQGSVKAFGKRLEETVIIEPNFAVPKGVVSRVGPFKVRLGAYERQRNSSTLSDADWAFIDAQAELYGGMFLFRDQLRVLPFGRPDYDFFEIEKRRTLQAGREFWSYRRMFGSIEISLITNSNLRDKAGREGLIDNQSAKAFRGLIENVLMTSARRYFGYAAEDRATEIEKIKRKNQQDRVKEQQAKLAQRRREQFRKSMKAQVAPLTALVEQLSTYADTWTAKDKVPEDQLLERRVVLLQAEAALHRLYLADPPGDISESQAFQDYSTAYRVAASALQQLTENTLTALAKAQRVKPAQIFSSEADERRKSIVSSIAAAGNDVSRLLSEAGNQVQRIGEEISAQFDGEAVEIARSLSAKEVDLSSALGALDQLYMRTRTEIEQSLTSIATAVEALKDNIDLSVIAGAGLDELSRVREEMSRINALAQLGITVEIIGHELESLDATVSRGLKSFPKDFQTMRAYQLVAVAHKELTDRLRFLSPLKLSGLQPKETIKGHEIHLYVRSFFDATLRTRGIEFDVSEDFERFRIFDRKARIFPVFINLMNNSLYWVAQKKGSKRIALDVRDGKVVFGDDGPGVTETDRNHLFSLFFTRRASGGRGVGLFLCKANLAAGGHRIWYATGPQEEVLPGANFVIEFMGSAVD